MVQLPRLASGVDPSPAQRTFALHSNEQGAAKLPSSDQDLARVTRVNVLVVGAEDEAATLITSLWPSLVTPIVVRHRGAASCRRRPPVGTIVIYDVDTLTSGAGVEPWLTAGNAARRRERRVGIFVPDGGVFDGYHRLNMVTIDLIACRKGRASA